MSLDEPRNGSFLNAGSEFRAWHEDKEVAVALLERIYKLPGAEAAPSPYAEATLEQLRSSVTSVGRPHLSDTASQCLAAASDPQLPPTNRWAARSPAARAEKVADHLNAVFGPESAK